MTAPAPPALASLARMLQRSVHQRVGQDELVALSELAGARPDLFRGELGGEVDYAVASLLATSHVAEIEFRGLVEQWRTSVRQPSPERGADAGGGSTGTAAQLRGKGRRWRVALGAVVLVALALIAYWAWSSYPPTRPEVPAVASSPAPGPTLSAPGSSTVRPAVSPGPEGCVACDPLGNANRPWIRVPTDALLPAPSHVAAQLGQQELPLAVHFALLCAGLLLAVGVKLAAYARELVVRRRELAAAAERAWHHAQAVVAKPTHARTYLRLPEFMVQPSTRVLQTGRQAVAGRDLDEVATIAATLDAGMVPTLVPRRLRPPRPALLLLVDVERSGRHFFLPHVWALVAQWARAGVSLEVYTFDGDPTVIRPLRGSGQPSRDTVALARLLEKHPGPLVIASRALSPLSLRDQELPLVAGEPAEPWLSVVRRHKAARRLAWLDFDPASRARPALEVRLIEVAGLVRFDLTRDGLLALSRHLVLDEPAAIAAGRPIYPLSPDELRAVSTEASTLEQHLVIPRRSGAALVHTLLGLAGRASTAASHVEPWRARFAIDNLEEAEGRPLTGVSELVLDTAVASGPLDHDSATTRQVYDASLADLDKRLQEEPENEGYLEARRDELRFYREPTEARLRAWVAHAERAGRDEPAVSDTVRQGLERELRTAGSPVLRDGRFVAAVQRAVGQPSLLGAWRSRPGVWLVAGLLGAVPWLTAQGLRGDVERPGISVSNPGDFRLKPQGWFPATAYRPAMLSIPGGPTIVGSPPEEAGREANEVMTSTVVAPYFIAETEVTQAQFEALLKENPSRFTESTGGGPNNPVEQVSWFDAVRYANEVSELEALQACYLLERCAGEVGKTFACDEVRFVPGCSGYRLPSEVEWEHAARAGESAATYAGPMVIRGVNDAPVLADIAHYGGNSDAPDGFDCSGWKERASGPGRKCATQPVALKRANRWGLYDVLGNVWEWTDTPRDLAGAGWHSVDGRLVLRGCSFFGARYCRAAYRGRDGRDARYRAGYLGFRLTRSRVQ